MKARHFRFMYQNIEKGIMHTISVANTAANEKCNIYYIGSLKENTANDLEADEKYAKCQEIIDMIVVADCREASVGQALKLAETNQVKRVILPGNGNSFAELKQRFQARGVSDVLILGTGEMVESKMTGWYVKIVCMGTGDAASLVMFHNTVTNNPEEEDCVFAVRPLSEEMPSEVSIDPDNLSCDMRGTLYNDFDMCKGHNRKDSTGYVTGTLLLGTIDLEMFEEVTGMFAEERKTIRFITLPDGGKDQSLSEAVLNWINHQDQQINQYYIIPAAANGNEGTIKEILRKGARYIPVLTGKTYGHHASGFFVKR